jgi:hypothetical protein
MEVRKGPRPYFLQMERALQIAVIVEKLEHKTLTYFAPPLRLLGQIVTFIAGLLLKYCSVVRHLFIEN